VVYAKKPFAGPEQVLDYVGRYTHRVAISNNRLLDIAEDKVTFRSAQSPEERPVDPYDTTSQEQAANLIIRPI
jgi:hypothetical protein